MNDKLKNKINKLKIVYIRSNDNINKRTQRSHIRKGEEYQKSYHIKSNRYRSSYCNKNLQSNDNKHSDNKQYDNTAIKINHGRISGKSFIDPKILRLQRTNETRVYGENACQALFQNRPNCIVRAWFIQSITPRFKKALHWMATNRKAYHIVDNAELTKLSGTEHHGGICFLIKKRHGITVEQWVKQINTDDCVLALEDISNPYNLGGMMRSCAHFGVKGILLQNASLLESGAAIRTAEGGAEYVQSIISDNIINALQEFRKIGYTIVTTSSHAGIPLFKSILPRKMVLVLGQERNGLSNAALLSADFSISIDGTGSVESLNTSVATGILLGEWWRQNKI